MGVIGTLDAEIKKVAPIFGVAFGRKADKSTWRIDFRPEATAAERMLAQDVVNTFDVAVEERKLADALGAREAARERVRNLPDNANVTAKNLREAGLV